jgi:hypothetical protein
MLAETSIYPIGATSRLSKYFALVIHALGETGLTLRPRSAQHGYRKRLGPGTARRSAIVTTRWSFFKGESRHDCLDFG